MNSKELGIIALLHRTLLILKQGFVEGSYFHLGPHYGVIINFLTRALPEKVRDEDRSKKMQM